MASIRASAAPHPTTSTPAAFAAPATAITPARDTFAAVESSTDASANRPSVIHPSGREISMGELAKRLTSVDTAHFEAHMDLYAAEDLEVPMFGENARVRILPGTSYNLVAEVEQGANGAQLSYLLFDFNQPITLRNPASVFRPNAATSNYVLDKLSHINIESLHVYNDGLLRFTGSGLFGPVYVSIEENEAYLYNAMAVDLGIPQTYINTDLAGLRRGDIIAGAAAPVQSSSGLTYRLLGMLQAIGTVTGPGAFDFTASGQLGENVSVKVDSAHLLIDATPYNDHLHGTFELDEQGAVTVQLQPTQSGEVSSKDVSLSVGANIRIGPDLTALYNTGQLHVAGRGNLHMTVPHLSLGARIEGSGGDQVINVMGGAARTDQTSKPAAEVRADFAMYDKKVNALGTISLAVSAEMLTTDDPPEVAGLVKARGTLALKALGNVRELKGPLYVAIGDAEEAGVSVTVSNRPDGISIEPIPAPDPDAPPPAAPSVSVTPPTVGQDQVVVPMPSP